MPRARESLDAAGYTTAAVRAAVGASVRPDVQRGLDLGTDPGERARQVLPIARQLVERGYLVPPAAAAEAAADQ